MTANTTLDLDAIERRISEAPDRTRDYREGRLEKDWIDWTIEDRAALARAYRAQQQRIAELEAQLIKDPIGEGELTAHVDCSRLQGNVEKPR